MHFLLTTLKVVNVLSTPMPEFVEDEPLEQTRRRYKWNNDDYICRGHILNGMYEALFDVYQNMSSAKELWDQLESKYMVEDASTFLYLEMEVVEVEFGCHLEVEFEVVVKLSLIVQWESFLLKVHCKEMERFLVSLRIWKEDVEKKTLVYIEALEMTR
ncbi:hypothetical protein Tco_0744286 [Tanacetum coccineum]